MQRISYGFPIGEFKNHEYNVCQYFYTSFGNVTNPVGVGYF